MAEQEHPQDPGQSPGEGAADYFSQYNLVDDNGSPMQDPEPANPESKKETPAAKPAKAGDEPGAEPKKDGPATGIEAAFFKADPKGNSVFDADGAYNYLKTAYVPMQYNPKPAPAPQQAAAPQQEQVPAWKKRLEEKRQYRENLMAPRQIYDSAFNEALRAGYQPAQAVQYAHQVYDKAVAQHTEEWEAEQAARDEEERAKRDGEIKTRFERKAKYDANVAAVVKRLGGEDNYSKLITGFQDASGKFVPGLVTDVLYKFYDRDNPEKPMTKETMADWWENFGADEHMLSLLVEVGLARLQARLLPQLIQHGAKVQAGNAKQQKIAGTRPIGSKNAVTQKAGGGDDAIANFFKPPSERFVENTV